MQSYLTRTLVLLSLWLWAVLPAQATEIQAVGTYPYIADLLKQIGGSRLHVNSLASGEWDPHFVVPKPSLLSRLRQADLLVINGAQLEIGWLPPMLRQSGNARIQTGARGFLELAPYAQLIQKPQNVSRALGDVHPQGNPHFVLNPDNIPRLAAAITQKLCQLDGPSCPQFKHNQQTFVKRWQLASQAWSKRMSPLKGQKVLEHHRLHDYFLHKYGLKLMGTLEPLPGIPPSPQQLSQLVEKAKKSQIRWILRGSYNPKPPAEWAATQLGIPTLMLPHDLSGEAKDIFALYETILKRLGV